MPESSLLAQTFCLVYELTALKIKMEEKWSVGWNDHQEVTCKLCSYSKSYDLLIHQGPIANVHGVIIFQAAKEQNCSKLALLRGGVAAGKVTEMVVSQRGLVQHFPMSHPTGGARGPHGTWSVADKTALGQNFMNKKKTPLIFHGSMLMSTLIIVHVNISSSWRRIRLGVI